MFTLLSRKFVIVRRLTSLLIAFTLSFTLVVPAHMAQAQSVLASPVRLGEPSARRVGGLNLPPPGIMVPLSPAFTPALIKGMKIFPDDPLRFDFIIDPGDSGLSGEYLTNESSKLIKYFLASITVPEEDMWVNLSPYEKDRIITDGFGQTEMGRDLLAQDYLLKQITASLMYPEEEIGKEFWERIYKKANDLYGTTEIPVNTFNKVWIVPQKATVYENGDTVFVTESHLKVMLEEDYRTMDFQQKSTAESLVPARDKAQKSDARYQILDTGIQHPASSIQDQSSVSSEIIRAIIIPELEKEINTGENFANLRQIYHAVILATWFKRNLKESYLGQVYADQNKIDGVDIEDRTTNEKIYQQYLAAFQTGVYDFIKEEYDANTQEVIPRKYFSGGARLALGAAYREEITSSPVELSVDSMVAETRLASSSPVKSNEGGARKDSEAIASVPNELILRGQKLKIVPLTRDLVIAHKETFFGFLDQQFPSPFAFDIDRHVVQWTDDSKEFVPELSFAVLNESGDPIASLNLRPLDKEKELILKRFSVIPQFQGSPVAKWLLYYAFKNGFDQGYEVIHWYVAAESEEEKGGSDRAIPLYDQIGAELDQSEYGKALAPKSESDFQWTIYIYHLKSKLPGFYKEFQRKLASDSQETKGKPRSASSPMDEETTVTVGRGVSLPATTNLEYSNDKAREIFEHTEALALQFRRISEEYRKRGKKVVFNDVTLRDGIQAIFEAGELTAQQKIGLIKMLIKAGVTRMEVTSFVSKKLLEDKPDLLPGVKSAGEVAEMISQLREDHPEVEFGYLIMDNRRSDELIRMDPEMDEVSFNIAAAVKYAIPNFGFKEVINYAVQELGFHSEEEVKAKGPDGMYEHIMKLSEEEQLGFVMQLFDGRLAGSMEDFIRHALQRKSGKPLRVRIYSSNSDGYGYMGKNGERIFEHFDHVERLKSIVNHVEDKFLEIVQRVARESESVHAPSIIQLEFAVSATQGGISDIHREDNVQRTRAIFRALKENKKERKGSIATFALHLHDKGVGVLSAIAYLDEMLELDQVPVIDGSLFQTGGTQFGDETVFNIETELMLAVLMAADFDVEGDPDLKGIRDAALLRKEMLLDESKMPNGSGIYRLSDSQLAPFIHGLRTQIRRHEGSSPGSKSDFWSPRDITGEGSHIFSLPRFITSRGFDDIAVSIVKKIVGALPVVSTLETGDILKKMGDMEEEKFMVNEDYNPNIRLIVRVIIAVASIVRELESQTILERIKSVNVPDPSDGLVDDPNVGIIVKSIIWTASQSDLTAKQSNIILRSIQIMELPQHMFRKDYEASMRLINKVIDANLADEIRYDADQNGHPAGLAPEATSSSPVIPGDDEKISSPLDSEVIAEALVGQVESFLMKGVDESSEGLVRRLSQIPGFDLAEFVPSPQDQERIASGVREIVERRNPDHDPDGKKESNRKKGETLTGYLKKHVSTDVTLKQSQAILRNVRNWNEGMGEIDRMDVIGLFQNHAKRKEVEKLSPTLEHIMQIAKRQHRPVVFIKEEARFSRKHMEDLEENRSDHFRESVYSGARGLSDDGDAHDYFNEFNQRLESSLKQRLGEVVHDSYDWPLSQFLQKYRDVEYVVEGMTFTTWKAIVRHVLNEGFLTDEEQKRDPANFREVLRWHIYSLRDDVLKRRDQYIVNHQLKSIQDRLGNPIVIIVRGSAHNRMFDEHQLENTRFLTVTMNPERLERPAIVDPVKWFAQQLADDDEVPTYVEDFLFEYLSPLVDLHRRIKANTSAKTEQELFDEIEQAVRGLVGNDIFVRLAKDYPQNIQPFRIIESASGGARASSSPVDNPGGIDFNPNNIDLQLQGRGINVNYTFDPKDFENIPINGFTPVIFRMTPITHFPLLFGETQEQEQPDELILSKFDRRRSLTAELTN